MGQAARAATARTRVDRAPLVPDPGVRRFVQSMELEWPIDSLEPLSFVLARLLDPLSSALERADRGAAALRLDLRLVDRTIHGRVLPLPAAIRDAKVLRTLLLLDLESHPPSTAVDIVTIEIDPAPARIVRTRSWARDAVAGNAGHAGGAPRCVVAKPVRIRPRSSTPGVPTVSR